MPAWESEQRDDHGRFSSGGGDASAAPGTDAYEAHLEKMEAGAEQATAVWSETPPAGVSTDPPYMGRVEGTDHYLEYSNEVNTALRLNESIPPDSINGETVAGMDAAIAESKPTTEDTTLFRGVALSGKVGQPPEYGAMKPGTQFREPGYSSTSTSYGMAREFSENDGKGQMLEIQAPAGSRGLYISQSEGEVVLPHGQGFEVVSQEPDRTVVKAIDAGPVPDIHTAIRQIIEGRPIA